MKSRETLIRLKRFQVDEKRRKVMQIEMMIADLDRMAAELEREIQSEERKAGISDPAHYAYPTYAKATRSRTQPKITLPSFHLDNPRLNAALDGTATETHIHVRSYGNFDKLANSRPWAWRNSATGSAIRPASCCRPLPHHTKPPNPVIPPNAKGSSSTSSRHKRRHPTPKIFTKFYLTPTWTTTYLIPCPSPRTTYGATGQARSLASE